MSEQEIRNSTIRLLDNTFNDFIIQLSKSEDFKICIANLSREQYDQKIDQEYVLKFFAFKNNREEYRKNIAPFLTDYMEKVADSQLDKDNNEIFDYQEEEKIFKKTFAVLNKALGENVFARVNKKNKNFIISLSPNHFDAFTMGIQKYLDLLKPEDQPMMEELGQLLKDIKSEDEFIKVTGGGGKNTANFLRNRIEYVENKVGVWIRERGKAS
ncbi:hypothetical protein [Pseudogracilibacillus sp. SO30301A]|uniref:hypothetical protein n=1 Tax=Pseudogracilibacillus sp. SO30301A TaxID=3098291 RepID=UPI00300E1EE1